MDFMNIDGQYGHFTLNLKEIQIKGIAYIVLNNYSDLDKVLNEAKAILLNYSPKIIYFMTKNKTAYPVFCTKDVYYLPYTRFKANKDLKFKPLDLENRYQFSKMATVNMFPIDLSESYSDGDIFRLYKNKEYSLGYIQFRKQFIGVYIIKGKKIELFCIDQPYLHQGLGRLCLEKLINRIDSDVYIDVVSSNKKAINLLLELGFNFTMREEIWYILEG